MRPVPVPARPRRAKVKAFTKKQLTRTRRTAERAAALELLEQKGLAKRDARRAGRVNEALEGCEDR